MRSTLQTLVVLALAVGLLALFLYRVYLGFYPQDIAPQSTPAPAAAPAGA